MLSPLLEGESRAGDQILDRAGDEHLSGRGERRDAGARDDGDSGELLADELALPRVNAGTHVEAELRSVLDDPARAGDCSSRTVESAEEPVSGRIDFLAIVAPQLPADVDVVSCQKVSPCAVADLGCSCRRSDDVGEERGRQHRARDHGLGFAPHELEDCIGSLPAVGGARESSELHLSNVADAFDDELCDSSVPLSMEHEGRHTNRPENLRDVRLEIQAPEVDGRGRAYGQPVLPERPASIVVAPGERGLHVAKVGLQEIPISPALPHLAHERQMLLLAHAVRIRVGLDRSGVRPRHDESVAALGVRSREQRASVRAGCDTEERSSLQPHVVQDGRDIIHPRFEGDIPRSIGKPGAASIEGDESNLLDESVEEPTDVRDLPETEEIAEMRREDEIVCALADHLVGDRDPTGSGVAHIRDVHGREVSHYTHEMATTATERQLLIGNEWVETGEWIDVRSPYDGTLVGRVPSAGAAEARRAIDAAEAAMAEPIAAHERATILDRVAALLAERHDEVARTICAEAGKPLKAARVEAARAVSTFTMAAVEARKLAGDVVPMDASPAGEGKLAFTIRVPIGVVGAISPFNFPLNLVAHKVAPALAAGCAVVLKPAGQTPLSALLLAEVELEVGLPPGWLNVVCGPASEIGDVLVQDERVKLITFTGSVPIGWRLRERAARKRVSLELGNATPVIVAADADLEDSAARLAANAFSFAGQSCISVQRIYVESSVYDRFLSEFIPRVHALTVGDPADEATDVGPLISAADRDRVRSWVEEARAAGAEILTGGDLDGELLRPTVIANAPPDAKVSCEEIFGPVCTVTRYETLDQAIALANGTRFGLQAGVFTRDVKAALRAARELEFGGVVVNEAPTFRADQMPYGGVKDSGNTREGPAYAIREMTEERTVVFQL